MESDHTLHFLTLWWFGAFSGSISIKKWESSELYFCITVKILGKYDGQEEADRSIGQSNCQPELHPIYTFMLFQTSKQFKPNYKLLNVLGLSRLMMWHCLWAEGMFFGIQLVKLSSLASLFYWWTSFTVIELALFTEWNKAQN